MMADEGGVIDFAKQNQWAAKPDKELKVPKAYITQLRHEIVVLTEKKPFTFRCADYEVTEGGAWRFENVIIDSSKLDAKGEVELKRVTYHPELKLVNSSFMIVPAPEDFDAG